MDAFWNSYSFYLGVCFALLLGYMLIRKPRNLPPGPFSLPVIGSVGLYWSLRKYFVYEAFAMTTEKYGSVLSVWVGPKLIVVLNGYDTIHQALVKQASDFIDRPELPLFAVQNKNGKGIGWSNGQEWKVLRKITSQSLRDFGKTSIESKIFDEFTAISDLLKDVSTWKDGGKAVWNMAVCNVICSIMFGQRFDYEDETFTKLLYCLDTEFKGEGGLLSLVNFIPDIILPLFQKTYKEKLTKTQARKDFQDIISDLELSRKKIFDPENINDFLDIYLQASENSNDPSTSEYFHSGNMRRTIADIFLAASDAAASTLTWVFLYMVEYPRIQTKCRRLIQEVIGETGDIVTLADRPRLTYIEATLQEVQRLSTVGPLGVPRTCLDHDVNLFGYTIPKQSIIVPNVYTAHMDPKHWNKPNEFNPERFLNDDNKLVKNPAFIPFLTGPRNCAGESVAKSELFLFFSNLIAKFEFKHKDGSTKHNFLPQKDRMITMTPDPYTLKCVPIK